MPIDVLKDPKTEVAVLTPEVAPTTETTKETPTPTPDPIPEDNIAFTDFLGGAKEGKEDKTTTTSVPETTPPKTSIKDTLLEGIDEADRPLFSKMANDAKQRMAAIYRERVKYQKELEQRASEIEQLKKSAQPQAWHEHPDAYMLLPEFKESVNLRQQAVEENKFWRAQYEKIRKGEDWLDLVPDGKGGIATQTMQPSAAAEADVLSYINETNRVASEQMGKLTALRENFTGQHKSVVATIEDASKKFFPPELQDFEKARQENPYVKTMAESLDKLGLQRNPLYKTVANLYALLMAARVAKAKETEKPVSITPKEIQSGASGKPADLVSFDEFEKAKQGLS